MINALHAAGGIALVLFGIRFFRKGLDRLVGGRLDVWLGRLAGRPGNAAGAGLLMGAVVPSSTSLGLLTVSLVRDGSLRLPQAMAALFGAFVGITAAVHLIAFDLLAHAPLLALAGVVLFQGTRVQSLRAVGQILIGLAVIFIGIGVVAASAGELAASEAARTLVRLGAENAWAVALLGAVLAVVSQSSTATVAVLLALGAADPTLLRPGVALPFVIGVNVGLAVTVLLAGWSHTESRRLGAGVLALRAAAAVGAIVAVPTLAGWAEGLAVSPARQVAAAHTAFNLAVLLVGVPLARPLTRLVERLVPAGEADDTGPRFISTRWAAEPAVALAQSKREISRISGTVQRMLDEFWEALKTGDEAVLRRIRDRDDHVDRLDRAVKLFLTRQVPDDLPEDLARARVGQLRFLTDLETVGDVIDRNLADVAAKKLRKGVRFSDEGWRELKRFYASTTATLELATAVFVTESPDLARKLLDHKARVRDEEITLRENHYARLRAGEAESMETTDLHLEVLGQLKHITHVMAGVAYTVLRNERQADAPDEGGKPADTLPAGA